VTTVSLPDAAEAPTPPPPDPAAAAAWHHAADQLAEWTVDRLVVRDDRYGGYRLADGPPHKQTKPPAGPRPGAFSATVLATHFRATGGEHVVGGHPLTAATEGAPSFGKWVGIDLDNHGGLPEVSARNLRYALHLHRKLTVFEFHPLLCSWGTGGFHLWVCLGGQVRGDVLHAFGKWIVADAAEFGFRPPAQGDPASGWPESNPKTASTPRYGNWLRFPGRHHSRDTWAVVFDGTNWVQGAAAVACVLDTPRSPTALIPAEAAPGAALPTDRPKTPMPTRRPAHGPALKVVGDRGDVFEAYNLSVGIDLVVSFHEQMGRHQVVSRAGDRVDFRRDGKEGGASFNVKVVGGVPVTFNFSTNAGLPTNDGLSPSEVRCFYEHGRCDKATMREFSRTLRRELGWEIRVEAAPAPQNDPTLPPAGRPPSRGRSSRITEHGYTVFSGGTYHCQMEWSQESREMVPTTYTKLANFSARVVREAKTDDGVVSTLEFTVEVEHPSRAPVTITVPADKLTALDWVVERLGVGYIIQPGRGTKEALRAAIQELSGDPQRTTVFAHTGWREVDGRWVYLHAGGAIGAPDGSVSVRLEGAAAGFHLPAPPAGDELRAAVRASLGVVRGLAPDAVTFPLLAAVYRAPLGGADYGLWLAGQTGAQKSELAALAQQHYGAGMTRTRLPGNWSSTDNALEALAFTVKDAVLVVDDFAPPASRPDADRLHRTADRLVRGAGNAAGRQRQRADGTARPDRPPRALVAATGEDLPRGHSIAARLCAVSVRRGSVDLPRLSSCQRDAAGGQYAAALAGYLAWLAPHYAAVSSGLAAERAALRDRFVGRFPHARTPDVVANQLLGVRYLLRFAEEVGALAPGEQEALWERGQAALRAVAEEQGEGQREADPVARFPEQLAALVSSGDGHLAAPDGSEPHAPLQPTACGWERRESGSAMAGSRVSWAPRGRKLGWIADGILYLDRDATYAGLVELSRRQGQAYPLGSRTLWMRLNEAGLLVRTQKDRTTYKAELEGVRRDVLFIAVETVFPLRGPTPDGVSRSPCPGPGGEAEGPGRRYDANSLEKPLFVPAVPVVPASGTEERNGARGDDLDDYDRIAR
jgi:hypothetical protein